MDCKLGDFLCSQNQTASWKLKVIRKNLHHDTGNVIPIIPVCGSSFVVVHHSLVFCTTEVNGGLRRTIHGGVLVEAVSGAAARGYYGTGSGKP